MKVTFNDLLRKEGMELEKILVLRHRPKEAKLNKVLPWLAVERPELFNAYQQTQGEKVEKAMQTAKYVAAFLGREAGRALFVGLFSVQGWRSMPKEECERLAETQELYRLGMQGFSGDDQRSTILWFDLVLTDFYASWMGKLVIDWPGRELSWWRWADRNHFALHAVHEESVLDAVMPSWDTLDLSWEELQVIPRRWKAALKEWRGIYFIHDQSDGKGYVGSAYGEENLLGRWKGYADSGHGGNKLLKGRDPRNFRFSILQRVSPDLSQEDVVEIENTWKIRLHTRPPFGLNEN